MGKLGGGEWLVQKRQHHQSNIQPDIKQMPSSMRYQLIMQIYVFTFPQTLANPQRSCKMAVAFWKSRAKICVFLGRRQEQKRGSQTSGNPGLCQL